MALEQLNLAATPENVVTNGVESVPASVDGGDDVCKAPRLPRWTRQEILVLIQGKRVAESRVRRGRVAGIAFGSGPVEPKWASISSYCKRHGVNRGPGQCRKRWSNLSGDFKKIREWENNIREGTESFWVMRNDLRKERKLPAFFDKEVYDILDGRVTGIPSSDTATASAPLDPTPAAQDIDEDADAVFDSGRTATVEDGLFSNFDQDDAGESPEMEEPAVAAAAEKAIPSPIPISGMRNEKHSPSDPEVGSARKRKRMQVDGDEEMSSLQYHMIDVLERNGKMVAAKLEAQNTNLRQDRKQRKDEANKLVAVLNRLADSLGRIAEKL